jgi:hypothetical protein
VIEEVPLPGVSRAPKVDGVPEEARPDRPRRHTFASSAERSMTTTATTSLESSE